ncbi:MAG TPA: 6-phosphogluconolactonase [Steroidobacteraceae bacterium]
MHGTAKSDTRERRFPTAAALTEALALEITGALQDGLAAGRGASLAVPGGRTPVALFERLSRAELDWEDVWITLTDERWVEVAGAASNEKLVRDHLLRAAAAAANLVGLKNAAADAAAGAHRSWSRVAELPRPFDFMLLGMGEDGHVASLFPGAPGLAAALDTSQPPGCVAMVAPSPPQERLSLNLRALLDSRRIALLIAGAAKWASYERALARGPVADMPVRALLQQRNVPLSVYWAP